MNVQAFLDAVGNAPPALVYFFCPAKAPRAREATFEAVLAHRAVERVVETYVDPSLKDLCHTVFYADETDPREVVDTARTVPFLAERRIVVVHKAERYAAETTGKPLLAYLESPSDTTILLLLADRVDKRTKLYKACAAAGEIVECPELREQEVMAWARSEIDAREKTIDSAALRELVDRTGTRLGDVQNAVCLVTNYVGYEPRIRREDVVAACADVDEEEVWALTDAIAASNTGRAIRALREIVDPNKNEFQILGSINWLLKSAYGVAAGGAAGQKVNAFVARKVKPLADKIGLPKFRDAFALCLDTDLMMRSTGVDRSLALELLVIKLAAPRGRRSA